MQVEGLVYHGIQSGFGLVPDALTFTDVTTNSTFCVADATPEKVAARRDEHRRDWQRQSAKHAESTLCPHLPL
jgi:hypothetical protein